VTARYGGDGVFGASSSAPAAIRVTPENSSIHLSLSTGQEKIAAGGDVPYNTPAPLTLSVQPVGASSVAGRPGGIATGSATFTIDAISATIPLNANGEAIWTPPALSIGTHTASATYSGDASYNPSSSSPVSFTVSKGRPFMNAWIDNARSPTGPGYNIEVGGSLTMTVVVGTDNGPTFGDYAPLGTATPTGTVTACLDATPSSVCVNSAYSQTAALTSPTGVHSLSSTATFTFSNLAAGFYFPTFSYSGDANWQNFGLIYLTTLNVAPITSLTPTTTTLSITPASLSDVQFANISVTVAGSGTSGTAPAGEVDFYDNGVFLTYVLFPLGKSGSSASATFRLGASAFWNSGANQITAIYDGYGNYQSSSSNVVSVSVTQRAGDFSLVPQLPEIMFARGSSGAVGLNLTSLNNFNAAVSLSCATSSSNISCGVNPSAPTLNGSATAMLTVSAGTAAALFVGQGPRNRFAWLQIGGVLFACVLTGGFAVRNRQYFAVLLSFGLFAAVLSTAGCGGGGSQRIQPPPPPPAVGTTYNVIVTATANGIVHNAKITVVVR
jgi:hypothetical protein